MTSNITFFSNNHTIKTPSEIIVTNDMILNFDGVRFTKEQIQNDLTTLKILKNKLESMRDCNVSKSE